jgi:AcrR family transcriptional regulator
MGRWPADARDRLERAAFELLAERGYDGMTVADIASRADLNRATFFRHFADKREVLFGGEDRIADLFAVGIRGSAGSASLIDVLQSAFSEADAVLTEEQRTKSALRVAALTASVEVQERGLLKRARMTAAIRGALASVGFPELESRLGAELCMLTFSIAMERWLATEGAAESFSSIAAAVLKEIATNIAELRVVQE